MGEPATSSGRVVSVVMLGFREGVPDERRAELREQIVALFERLPQVLEHRLIEGLGLSPGSSDLVARMLYEDAESYESYRVDPDHRRLHARIVELCDRIVGVQVPAEAW